MEDLKLKLEISWGEEVRCINYLFNEDELSADHFMDTAKLLAKSAVRTLQKNRIIRPYMDDDGNIIAS